MTKSTYDAYTLYEYRYKAKQELQSSIVRVYIANTLTVNTLTLFLSLDIVGLIPLTPALVNDVNLYVFMYPSLCNNS